MPKRKDKKIDEYILKKLKKLQKKLKRRSSSESESSSKVEEYQLEEPVESSISHNIMPRELIEKSSIGNQTGETLMDEAPTKNNKYSSPIQKGLAVHWEHIATTGLQEGIKKEILEKYILPENCTKIGAPQLNPEIKAAVSESLKKKDKAFEKRQSQQAVVISCIGQALTKMFNNAENKETEVIKLLIDAAGLLCDTQYVDSTTRRNFVTSSLQREVNNHLYLTKINSFLFADCKTVAKIFNKPRAEIITAPSKLRSIPQPKQNLNWRPPFPPVRQIVPGKKFANVNYRYKAGVRLPPPPMTPFQALRAPFLPPQHSRRGPQPHN